MRKFSKWKILLSILLIYLIGYIGARKGGYIVHSVVRDHSNNYMKHSVVAGEGKFLGATIKGITSSIYTPCRFFEAKYWYWKLPVGTPLTKNHLQNLSK